MRDPDRIPIILSQIEMLWERYPDLRLGQLILNVFGKNDFYGVEDEELVDRLYGFYDDLEIRLEQE